MPYTDIVSSYDDTKIINTVLFTRTGGSQQSAVSDDSVQLDLVLTLKNSIRIRLTYSRFRCIKSIAKQKVVENDIPQTSVDQL